MNCDVKAIMSVDDIDVLKMLYNTFFYLRKVL